MADQTTRLSMFKVDKLFGEFSPRIPINLDEHVTAIIAPNGRGKTVCLRLINALFRRQWSHFNSVEFERVEYLFSTGEKISVAKSQKAEGDENNLTPSLNLRFEIVDSDGNEITWTPEPSEAQRSRIPQIDRVLPFLTRIGPASWRHDHTGQVLTFQEVVERYSSQFPPTFFASLYSKEPEILRSIISSIDCHLIETQRLLVLGSDEENPRYERRSATLAISMKAQTLKAIIARDFQHYATLSQSLDRSFPKRAIEETKFTPLENLRDKFTELDRQRKDLMDAGILEPEGSDPVSLPQQFIDTSVARVLSVYAFDTKQKLDSLSTLLERVRLFKRLIEQRFTGKEVEVDKEVGFKIKYHENNVPLEKLSSGEQHQLVLFFELLFELKPNALILIDEPELSLHVAWQKKFISDLQKVIELNKFDVVLATHSPQLIGPWQRLAVELGDVEAE